MIFDPDYAEMHYKFKLPWSVLFKKEPEIIIDAPFETVPGEEPTLYIVIREANRFPVAVEALEAEFSSGGKSLSKTFQIQESISKPFAFIPVPCGRLPPGKYEIRATATVRTGKGKKRIERFNLTGLKRTPLRMHVLESPIPKPEGYIAGDTHAHTYVSADPVEFGASPAVLQRAAKSVGLDFVFCTDHSYDFAFDKDDYMLRTDAAARYAALREEIAKLPEHPRLVAGEEVSAGNSEGRNVHLLFPGNAFFIPGEGDCGRKWLDNKPTLSIPQITAKTEHPCFAAHPMEKMGRIERFIFRRGNWSERDLQKGSTNPIAGLEFWNGSRDGGFFLGKAFWVSELEKGNFLLPLGGNDAHGDLNEYTGVKIPLLKLKQSRAHVFGYVRTVVKGSDPVNAFRGNNLFVTDGPALWWTIEDDAATFRFESTPDFGELKTFSVFAQKASPAAAREAEVKVAIHTPSAYEAFAEIPLKDFAYVRAEAETSSGRFALTSACPRPSGNVHTGTSPQDSCCR